MKNQTFNTAIKDGHYISVDELEPGAGEKCGCFCPECGQPLRSNVTAKSPEELKVPFKNHFTHIDTSTNCDGGVKKTKIHLLTHDILKNTAEIKVPGIPLGQPSSLTYQQVFFDSTLSSTLSDVYRPDLIIENQHGHQFLLAVDMLTETAKKHYRKHKMPVLQLDVSDYLGDAEEDVKVPEFKEVILENIDVKSWIGSRKFLEIANSNGIHPVSQSAGKIWKSVPNMLLIGAGLVLGALGITQWLRKK